MAKSSRYNLEITFVGLCLVMVSVCCAQVTVISGDYRKVLKIALYCGVSALICLCVPLFRGPLW